MNSHELFIHIHQGCFAGTGAIVRLPQCQWSKPDGYGKISQCITTTKHSKAKTVCIFLGIYCISTFYVIPPQWHDTGSWHPFSCKTLTYLVYIVNIMGVDVLATQGARPSTTMILTMLNRINYVSVDQIKIKMHQCLTRTLSNSMWSSGSTGLWSHKFAHDSRRLEAVLVWCLNATSLMSTNRSPLTYSISQEICTRFCCALLCCGYGIVRN